MFLNQATEFLVMKKNKPLNWKDEKQTAFDKIRLLMAAGTLSAIPDPNKFFDVYTNSSDYQLGTCIMQHRHPVAFTEQSFMVAITFSFPGTFRWIISLGSINLLLSQITKGRKLVEPTIVLNYEDKTKLSSQQ